MIDIEELLNSVIRSSWVQFLLSDTKHPFENYSLIILLKTEIIVEKASN